MDYKGIKCPVCDKPFTENDDIVVCPVCGAPYHRGCYKEKGACIFTDLHESGKTWAPPVPPDAPNTASELKDKECPNCGTLNAHSALFCNICGTSLTGAPDEHRNTGYNTQLGSSYFQRIFGIYGSYPLAIAAYNAGPGNVNKWLRANGDPRTGAIDMVEWIEAIPYGETRNYVQRVLENAVVYDLMNPPRAKSRGPANLSWYLGRNRTG